MKKIREGSVEFFTFESERISSEMPVFYNPEMKINRNISVLCAKILEIREICDVMSATGIMGLRYLIESGVERVWFNDKNPEAVRLIIKNLELNGLRNSGRVHVSRMDAAELLGSKKFECVDLDPFGTPSPFLSQAARAAKKYLFVTATDTSIVSYPSASLKKYGVSSMVRGGEKPDFFAELGLRIVLSRIMLECFSQDKAFLPVLCFAKRHFYRFFGRIKKSPGKISELAEKFGYVFYCFECGNRWFDELSVCPCGGKPCYTGPIYLGSICERDIVRKMSESACDKDREFLSVVAREEHPFYYDLHVLSKKLGLRVPKRDAVIRLLESRGFTAVKTHFSPTAVKTDADYREFTEAMREVSGNESRTEG
ncbi:MAG: hypothetical protein GXO63_00955 [Candidatus Micrarchaeota archaeon]|nr:hypothetical protein [Candidatus Micrarchaeota archaeon]